MLSYLPSHPMIKLAEMLYFCGSRTHWPDKSINSVRSFTCCEQEGGWWEIIALPVCTGRPALFITWWWGHSISATCWMIIHSPFTLLTMAVSPHTSPPPSPWQPEKAAALLPFLHLSVLSAGSASAPTLQHCDDGTNRCHAFQLP